VTVAVNSYVDRIRRHHPERFTCKPPQLPTGSWINPPDQPEETTH
jgi:hypothetical protein